MSKRESTAPWPRLSSAPPGAAGRACARCGLVVPAGAEVRWHGRLAFLCEECEHRLGTGEEMGSLVVVRRWRLPPEDPGVPGYRAIPYGQGDSPFYCPVCLQKDRRVRVPLGAWTCKAHALGGVT